MGLTFDSLIVLDRIEQFKKIRLVGRIGSCPESVIDKIEELLRKIKEDGETV
ncbi:MAG: type II toxin-antitoxin system PemK/MazF family toxin [Bacteroidales bacterium]|nr:type II toxin-antitoxin system PemK/MazF family toxin [Bacteroidales bacterium]